MKKIFLLAVVISSSLLFTGCPNDDETFNAYDGTYFGTYIGTPGTDTGDGDLKAVIVGDVIDFINLTENVFFRGSVSSDGKISINDDGLIVTGTVTSSGFMSGDFMMSSESISGTFTLIKD